MRLQNSQSGFDKAQAMTRCKICDAEARSFGRLQILQKYDIAYFRCTDCGFVQTEDPYWLEEAYADAIVFSDLGLIARNVRLSRIAARLIHACFDATAPCVDYGGGYGIFVRLMRDRGVNFFHHDPHAENLFARHFPADSDSRYEVATAFEVFEHLAQPLETAARLDRLAPNWLISTELLPSPAPEPGRWWYYVPEGGQHVALYTRRSLQVLAERFGRQLISNGRNLHLFSQDPQPPWLIRFLMRDKAARLMDRRYRRRSLMPADYRMVTGRKLA